jgi:hypothetical protein
MTPDEWNGLGAGVALALAAGTVTWFATKGGELRRSREYSFECPRFDEEVECRVLQDIRTGQWKDVKSCSAFVVPDRLLCARECANLANLGLLRVRT